MADQIFIPMISYENGLAAMGWLKTVFGLEEKEKWLAEDGSLSHGELASGGQVIMLATPSAEYRNPLNTRSEALAKSPYVRDGVLVRVKNVSETYERAKKEGATILSEVETGFPGTRFKLEDPQGHRWFVLEDNSI